MENVFDFLRAAMPWIVIGLLLAVFFARKGKKKRGKTQENDYGLLGMCLGMSFGSAIGISLGMLTGLVIGSCIKKKRNRTITKKSNAVFSAQPLLVLAGVAVLLFCRNPEGFTGRNRSAYLGAVKG